MEMNRHQSTTEGEEAAAGRTVAAAVNLVVIHDYDAFIETLKDRELFKGVDRR